MLKVVDKVKENMKSQFGNTNITLTIEVLEALKQGKSVVVDIQDEYTASISLGYSISVEDEV